MKIPVPTAICQQISQNAVRYAREDMRGYGWSDRALQAIQPMNQDGMVGIRTSLKYLMYQEKGTRPFLMHWVDGRTITMGCKQGDGPHFRRGGHVGEPGYVDIPHVGKVWRDQRWRNPGVKGRHFMQNGLNRAIQEGKPMIRAYAMSLLKGNT